MNRRPLLDIVVLERSAIFELLTCKDKSLLIAWDTLFVTDLGLDSLDGIGAFDLDSDGLSSEGLHKNLHDSQFC